VPQRDARYGRQEEDGPHDALDRIAASTFRFDIIVPRRGFGPGGCGDRFILTQVSDGLRMLRQPSKLVTICRNLEEWSIQMYKGRSQWDNDRIKAMLMNEAALKR
jgi:hypothetical protein